LTAIRLGFTVGGEREVGQEAVALLPDYGFSILNLNSVELGVYAFNTRAIRCCGRVDFKRVGVLRESRILGGVAHDTVVTDILASEFESPVVVPSIRASLDRTSASAG